MNTKDVTVMDLLLAVRENSPIYYHKDLKVYDRFAYSRGEELDFNALLPIEDDGNTIELPSYKEIDHEEIMRFYVREFVEEKEIRKQLFSILRRIDYIDAFLEKLRELDLYEDFTETCGDIYIQIFSEWAEKNHLSFEKG
ncbi:MAG: hypothetical protein NC432_04275 [Roseburia sp.]|nr:hypothetical protein [Roseburia sp.]MCM1097555.1 hypothetical protein [Ruminococcus flavefaciens]MCM1234519.1 hypothetical protein [Ruminococcus flavefaciens]